MNTRKLGQEAEYMAAQYLQKQGYQIIDRNFQCRIGEIDIIAKEGVFLVFIEVKAKTGIGFGLPEEAVNKRKQNKLIKIAEYYLIQKELQDISWRIDVIALDMGTDGQIDKIRLIKNAVEKE